MLRDQRFGEEEGEEEAFSDNRTIFQLSKAALYELMKKFQISALGPNRWTKKVHRGDASTWGNGFEQ